MTREARFWYFGDGRSRFMHRLFREWHRQLASFEKVLYDDLPYWYGERTNVGILAAGAVRLKGVVALEEFTIRRGTAPVSRAGRADLSVYDGRTERSYDFECKFQYVTFDWLSAKRVKSDILDAIGDIRTLPQPRSRSQRVVVAFVAPYLKILPPPAQRAA